MFTVYFKYNWQIYVNLKENTDDNNNNNNNNNNDDDDNVY